MEGGDEMKRAGITAAVCLIAGAAIAEPLYQAITATANNTNAALTVTGNATGCKGKINELQIVVPALWTSGVQVAVTPRTGGDDVVLYSNATLTANTTIRPRFGVQLANTGANVDTNAPLEAYLAAGETVTLAITGGNTTSATVTVGLKLEK